MKKNRKKSKSRSKSREDRSKSKDRIQAKNLNIKKIINEDSAEEDDMEYRSFKRLSVEAVKEMQKVPGLEITSSGIDTSHVECMMMKGDSYQSYLTATKILDCDPLIQILPYTYYDKSIRQYQFDVHQEYSQLDSTYLKKHPDHTIPNIHRGHDANHHQLAIPFNSALVASLHEIKRFQSNNNPADFNAIKKGTILGEMMIYYGANRMQLGIGPIYYYR